MTIRYLERNAIDSAAWDDCVAESRQCLIYAFSWYLDALTLAWGGIVAEEGGRYLAVMPLPFRRKYGVAVVYQHDYCHQLGIFCREDVDVRALWDPFLAQLMRGFRWVASYRFNEMNEDELHFPPQLNPVRLENLVLNLNQSYTALRTNYSTDRQTNLKRARNVGWLLETRTDIRPLIQLHRLHNEEKAVAGYQHLDLRIYDRFANAVDELTRRGLAQVWLARKADSTAPEAGGLFVFDRDRIIYLFNGASLVGRKQQARLWMINRLIEEWAGQSIAFDFESPAIGAESVKDYYRSFGAEGRAYTEISYNRLPSWLNGLRTVAHLVRKAT